jgi:hypothetical protein
MMRSFTVGASAAGQTYEHGPAQFGNGTHTRIHFNVPTIIFLISTNRERMAGA